VANAIAAKGNLLYVVHKKEKRLLPQGLLGRTPTTMLRTPCTQSIDFIIIPTFIRRIASEEVACFVSLRWQT